MAHIHIIWPHRLILLLITKLKYIMIIVVCNYICSIDHISQFFWLSYSFEHFDCTDILLSSICFDFPYSIFTTTLWCKYFFLQYLKTVYVLATAVLWVPVRDHFTCPYCSVGVTLILLHLPESPWCWRLS